MTRSQTSGPFRRRFRCEPSAPRLAREAVRRLNFSEAANTDALLVVSELVTNAVQHSGCDPADEVELVVELTSTGVIISVSDVGRSATEPEVRQGGSTAGGLGLHVVATLADRWGTDQASGRRVWAELAL